MTTDDDFSISILKTIAQSRLSPAAGELPPTPELCSALAMAFGSPSPAPASEGDLARAALDLLRQDPAFAEPIQLAAIHFGAPESPYRYLEPLTVTLTEKRRERPVLTWNLPFLKLRNGTRATVLAEIRISSN